MHVTLKVKVGRAEAHPLRTFDYADAKAAELACDGAQAAHTATLIASGVAPERVEFSREYVGVPAAKKAVKGAK